MLTLTLKRRLPYPLWKRLFCSVIYAYVLLSGAFL